GSRERRGIVQVGDYHALPRLTLPEHAHHLEFVVQRGGDARAQKAAGPRHEYARPGLAQCASSQLSPAPTSTSSGTASSATPPISFGNSARIRASSAFGTSSTSSSCTCSTRRDFIFSSLSQRSTAIIASLIRSAAVPCIGALIAARSAPCRRPACWARISGRYRRRPNTVST